MSTVEDPREYLGRTIAFINGKGGVGKTTLCANTGGTLARSGYKVLVVDIDPQGNLGLDLGYADGADDDSGRSLSGALQELVPNVNVLKEIRPGLDVVVGGSALHGASAALGARRRGQDVRDSLAKVLAPLAEDYDVILIDCPPGNESLQAAAMGAARWIVAPSRVDEGTGRGLSELADRLSDVLEVNPHVELLGIALFDIEKSATRVEAEARRMVEEIVGSKDLLFDASVRHSVSVAQQSRRYGKLVHELDEFSKEQPAWWKVLSGEAPAVERVTRSASNVADDIQALTEELVQRLMARETVEA